MSGISVKVTGWAALFSALLTFTIIGVLLYFFWKIIAFIILFLIALIFIGALSRRMNKNMLSGRMQREKSRKKKDVIDVNEYKVE